MSATGAKWAAVLVMLVGVGYVLMSRSARTGVVVQPARYNNNDAGGVIVPPDVFTGPTGWEV